MSLTKKDIETIFSYESTHDIINVIASTGSGKSTEIPYYVNENKKIIFVVVPTTAAARSICEFMKTRGVNASFAAEGEIRYSNKILKSSSTFDHNVVYITPGHAKRLLTRLIIAEEERLFCDYLLLDEAHLGLLDYEIIVGFWTKLISKPFLIMASATLASDSYANILANNFTIANFSVPPLLRFPVRVIYHNEVFERPSMKIFTSMAGAIVKVHEETPVPEEGDIWLAFCPGSFEVKYIISILETQLGDNLEVYPFYSSVSTENLPSVMAPAKANTRRLIVATNLAETALTVNGLTGIFDSLTEKVAFSSPIGDSLKLETVFCSQASATQRLGRTGRTNPGFVYRMITENKFHELPLQRAKEIDRVAIHKAVLEFLNIDISPEILGAKYMGKIKTSIFNLLDMEMIKRIGSDISVTELGKKAYDMPLSIRNSKFYLTWEEKNYPVFVGAVLSAIIETYKDSYFFDRQENDFVVILEIITNILNEFKTIYIPYKALIRYCQDKNLRAKPISDTINMIDHICRVSKITSFGSFDIQNVIEKAVPLFNEIFLIGVYESKRVYKYNENLIHIRKNTQSKEIIIFNTIQINNKIQGSLFMENTEIVSIYNPFEIVLINGKKCMQVSLDESISGMEYISTANNTKKFVVISD